MVRILVERDEYLSRGVHIGMRTRSKDMEPFIFHVKKNKLAVIDLEKTDQRIEIAGKFLANYKPEDVLVVSRKENGFKPLKKFEEATSAKIILGRFLPGMLTNPNLKNYMEPKIVVVTDPVEDKQAIREAVSAKISIIAICDTGNFLDYIDFVIPGNNKGKKSLGLIYFLLARSYLLNRKVIKSEKDFKYTIEDFTPE